MDYAERLRRFTFNDERIDAEFADAAALDGKTFALARIAALVAVGGAEPSFGAEADAAVGAGASPTEIVDVLVAVAPVVGLARVVAAAPKLALALGCDVGLAVGDEY
ncbi:carboxymuconolactone decarboxylase family protein [Agromyces sp. GXQ0307]|uniref:carboxymuconolactone decarboxylase family protein n=1 Tax=Agromyces sp. GXQ0307 TaxID=3377835 RepID=UPI00383B5377